MPTNTFCAVIEMVRTEAVGPETHINCINCSGKLGREKVNCFTNGRRIVGSSPRNSHLIFGDVMVAITKNASVIKNNSIELTNSTSIYSI
jgi:hypothetical protein